MAKSAFNGTPITTSGELPQVGVPAPQFELVGNDLSAVKLADFIGKRVVLNIFPSLDTGICAMSVRRFNQMAADLEDTVVLCISNDLPFAQSRFCGAEGIENVTVASGFRSTFGDDYGVTMVDGPLAGLLARAQLIIDESGKVSFAQLNAEIKTEPDYDAVLKALA